MRDEALPALRVGCVRSVVEFDFAAESVKLEREREREKWKVQKKE